MRRHLNREAVEVGPPSFSYQFRKFAGRNKALLSVATTVTALLLLGVAGMSWQAIRQPEPRDLRSSSNRRRRRKKTEHLRSRNGQENLNLAIQALDVIFLRVIEQRRFQANPDRERENQVLLQRALDFYSQFLLANGKSKTPELEDKFRRVLETETRLVELSPNVTAYRRHLAETQLSYAVFLETQSRVEEAETAYRQANTQYQELVNVFPSVPEYQNGLHDCHQALGHLLAATRPQEAATHYASATLCAKRQRSLPPNPEATVNLNHFNADSGLSLIGGIYRWRQAASNRNGRQAFLRWDAWHQRKQPVANGFSASFSFDFGGGFAFVIQNHSSEALGGQGKGMDTLAYRIASPSSLTDSSTR